MRNVLQSVGIPDHLSLAYAAWAPVQPGGKVPDESRADWLNALARLAVSPDYVWAFKRWKASFQPPGDRSFELTLASRLLVGHGNPSATDVGLAVHHTWGVPVIPGSALKGLLAHYVDAVYGPDDPDKPPWEQTGEERQRASYQGVTWRGRRIHRGPGEVYRVLFGAPDADEDDAMRNHGLEAGAAGGHIVFHDALYVPGSAQDDRPFAVDVLTVHQKGYYDSSGATWPNDYDSPNPVSFLTVRPGVRMLLGLSGPADWTGLAQQLLTDAIENWGVGGKTSSGYGRLIPRGGTGGQPQEVPTPRTSPNLPNAGDRVEAVLLPEKTRKDGWKARHEPTNLSGPIHNSADVPADKKPGDRLTLIVASANPREIAFRYPTAGDDRGDRGPGVGPKHGQGAGRPNRHR